MDQPNYPCYVNMRELVRQIVNKEKIDHSKICIPLDADVDQSKTISRSNMKKELRRMVHEEKSKKRSS